MKKTIDAAKKELRKIMEKIEIQRNIIQKYSSMIMYIILNLIYFNFLWINLNIYITLIQLFLTFFKD